MNNTGTHFYAKNEWVLVKVESTLKYVKERRANELKRVVTSKLKELNKPLNRFQKLFKKQPAFSEKEALEILEREYERADWLFGADLYFSKHLFDDLEILCYKLRNAAKVSDGGIYLSIDDMDKLR